MGALQGPGGSVTRATTILAVLLGASPAASSVAEKCEGQAAPPPVVVPGTRRLPAAAARPGVAAAMTALYQPPRAHHSCLGGGEDDEGAGLLMSELHLGGGKEDEPVGLTASSSWGFALEESPAGGEQGAGRGGVTAASGGVAMQMPAGSKR